MEKNRSHNLSVNQQGSEEVNLDLFDEDFNKEFLFDENSLESICAPNRIEEDEWLAHEDKEPSASSQQDDLAHDMLEQNDKVTQEAPPLTDDAAKLARDIAAEMADQSMSSFSVVAQSHWVSLDNGEQLHLRYIRPDLENADLAAANTLSSLNKRIFMLHGECGTGNVFYGAQGQGIANYFASLGYEVFVVDLCGRGRSLACGSGSNLSVYDWVTAAIPRVLKRVADFPSIAEQLTSENSDAQLMPLCLLSRSQRPATIWLSHGFGGVLLSATWARINHQDFLAAHTADWHSISQVEQMIFIGARRQIQGCSRASLWMKKILSNRLFKQLVNWLGNVPAPSIGLGVATENYAWFNRYAQWATSEVWVDQDGFNYIEALEQCPIPSSLHFAAEDDLYAHPSDVRKFVAELGCHDARTVILSKMHRENKTLMGASSYNHIRMLMADEAVQDVFFSSQKWLLEQQALQCSEAFSALDKALKALAQDRNDNNSEPVSAEAELDEPLCA